MPGDDGSVGPRTVEKISTATAVQRLCDEVRGGRLQAALLLDVIADSNDVELGLQLTSLAGQLGYSWEITA